MTSTQIQNATMQETSSGMSSGLENTDAWPEFRSKGLDPHYSRFRADSAHGYAHGRRIPALSETYTAYMNVKSKLAAAAVTGVLALSALAPMAFAQTTGNSMPCSSCGNSGWNGGGYGPVPTTNNFFGLGGGGFFGGTGNLGSLFVLDRLFSGPNGNGILSPYGGTSLGDMFILGQLFGGPGAGGGYF